MKYLKYIFILLVSAFAFWKISEGYDSYLVSFDRKIINIIQGVENNSLTIFFTKITDIADTLMSSILTAIIVVILYIIKKRKEAYFLFMTMAACGVIMYYIKNIFERPRPNFHRLIEISGFSFPSGHTTSATILYLSLAIIMSSIFVKINKKFIFSFAIIFILTIATSRVYLGVHYPTDTFGGMSLGVFVVTFFYMIYYSRFSKR